MAERQSCVSLGVCTRCEIVVGRISYVFSLSLLQTPSSFERQSIIPIYRAIACFPVSQFHCSSEHRVHRADFNLKEGKCSPNKCHSNTYFNFFVQSVRVCVCGTNDCAVCTSTAFVRERNSIHLLLLLLLCRLRRDGKYATQTV